MICLCVDMLAMKLWKTKSSPMSYQINDANNPTKTVGFSLCKISLEIPVELEIIRYVCRLIVCAGIRTLKPSPSYIPEANFIFSSLVSNNNF